MEKDQFISDYRIVRKIGEGSFGQIFQAEKNQRIYAIKTEHIAIIKPMLHIEYDIFKQLRSQMKRKVENGSLSFGGYDFPQVYQYGQKQHFSFLVMQKFDLTLQVLSHATQDLANIHLQNKIPKDVLLLIMFNTFKCLEEMHALGYLYRDVKPGNFMFRQIDLEQGKAKVYLIDLGLSKRYMKKDTYEHIKLRTNKKIIGTPIFCSLNTHKGLENSRRDDLQAWVYMMIYLVKKLPWQDYSLRKASKQQKQEEKNFSYDKIGKAKEVANIIQLIKQDDKLPVCLCRIFEQIRGLQFQARPNYELFSRLMQQQYSRLLGMKTNLSESLIRTKSLIGSKQQKPKKEIKFVFKIPDKKCKQQKKVDQEQSVSKAGCNHKQTIS